MPLEPNQLAPFGWRWPQRRPTVMGPFGNVKSVDYDCGACRTDLCMLTTFSDGTETICNLCYIGYRGGCWTVSKHCWEYV